MLCCFCINPYFICSKNSSERWPDRKARSAREGGRGTLFLQVWRRFNGTDGRLRYLLLPQHNRSSTVSLHPCPSVFSLLKVSIVQRQQKSSLAAHVNALSLVMNSCDITGSILQNQSPGASYSREQNDIADNKASKQSWPHCILVNGGRGRSLLACLFVHAKKPPERSVGDGRFQN